MKVISQINEWMKIRKTLSSSIGFVPTMGALHDGHKSLLSQSRSENELTVLSVFVNPTQFNDPRDLKSYPSTFNQDTKIAEELNVDYLIYPSFDEIYPDQYKFKLSENELSKILCGKHRPGHFDGVLTVVMKLFNIVKPQKAYFGEKDFQQLQLIKEMAQAFFMDIEIVPCPTVRDGDGLALSSRNIKLNSIEREKASLFHKILKSKLNCQSIAKELEANGFKVDYIEEHDGRKFGAVKLGDVRLIDNAKI